MLLNNHRQRSLERRHGLLDVSDGIANSLFHLTYSTFIPHHEAVNPCESALLVEEPKGLCSTNAYVAEDFAHNHIQSDHVEQVSPTSCIHCVQPIGVCYFLSMYRIRSCRKRLVRERLFCLCK